MRLREIFKDKNTNIFIVTDQSDENELNWTIEPTDNELIPEEENIYFTKAKEVWADKTIDCYLGVMTPERIAETVVKTDSNGQVVCESIYDQEHTVIPIVASDCYGDYSLFYSKENPEIGIQVLKAGLSKAKNKNIVAEDLGYILRDEERIKEAIDAFTVSEEFGPTSEHTFLELSRLYGRLGRIDKKTEYEEKFKTNGVKPSR
jgi:hypothetical protein